MVISTDISKDCPGNQSTEFHLSGLPQRRWRVAQLPSFKEGIVALPLPTGHRESGEDVKWKCNQNRDGHWSACLMGIVSVVYTEL